MRRNKVIVSDIFSKQRGKSPGSPVVNFLLIIFLLRVKTIVFLVRTCVHDQQIPWVLKIFCKLHTIRTSALRDLVLPPWGGIFDVVSPPSNSGK